MPKLSAIQALDVARDFDRYGGLNLDLLAWEFDVPVADARGAWADATRCELLERAAPLPGPPCRWSSGPPPRLWRLTRAGWDALAADAGTGLLQAS